MNWNQCSECVFVECDLGYYSESEYEPCIPCPQNTYRDSSGTTYCIPCPYGGKILVEGANSSEQCLVYHGNFDINHQRQNLTGVTNYRMYIADAPADRFHFNGTLVGWNVELTGYGAGYLCIFKEVILGGSVKWVDN